MAIVVVGAGRIGARFVNLALAKGDRVVLVEKDHERAELARERWVIEVLNGDATNADVLRKAGAPGVEGVIATTREDPVNLMVCLLARELGVQRTLALVNAPEARPMFEEADIDTVGNPSHLAAEALYRAVQEPQIQNFMRLGDDFEVVTMPIPADSEAVGKAIKDAGFGKNTLVAAVRRGSRVILPRGEFTLEEGDELTVVHPTAMPKTLLRRFKRTTGIDQFFG